MYSTWCFVAVKIIVEKGSEVVWLLLLLSSTSCLLRFLFGLAVLVLAELANWDRVGILMISWRIWSKAPSFSDDFRVKNAFCRSGEILLSASSLTSTGSCNPARANSTKDFGRVAEKS